MPEKLLFAIIAGLFGMLIGSFLNVCIYRWPRDLSVVKPRSFCPECEKPIAAYDNIPVLSYLVLRGRCRNCGVRIPWRYPIVELLTGACFFISVYAHGLNGIAVKFAIFTAMLVVLIFTDLEDRILPDEITIGGALAGIVLAAFVPMPPSVFSFFFPTTWEPRWVSVGESVLGAIFTGGLLWGFATVYGYLRSKEMLGLGDVKMVAMIGAFFGLQGTLLALVLGCVLGVFIGGGFMLATGKKASEYPLPLGTFLALAALILSVGGGPILAWYATVG